MRLSIARTRIDIGSMRRMGVTMMALITARMKSRVERFGRI